MPELPEVETIRRDLAVAILNRHIASVDILSPKTASHSAAFFKKVLVGRKIIKVGRRGKLLIFKLSLVASMRKKGKTVGKRIDYLLIHLKMTGQLIYSDKKNKIAGGHSLMAGGHSLNVSNELVELPNKHTRAILTMDNGGRLFFNDLRKFGYLKLVSGSELEKLLENNYGPEPLTPAFTFPAFQKSLSRTNVKIKAALLNQKLIAGLGNIYADEVLWAARISPERPTKKVTLAELKKLFAAINKIISLAIKQRGTTFSDYVDSRGRRGNFSKFLKVYGRGGEKCPNCHNPLKKQKIAGRGTHYCPKCQK